MGKEKINIPMCMALILLLLTMISIHMTSGLYARYSTTATGSDSARVAKFQVFSSPEKDEIEVDCALSNDGEYTFTVTNHSEVAVCYSVTVTFKSAFPATMLSVSLDDGTPIYVADNKVAFSKVGELEPNGDSAMHSLKFTVTQKEFMDSVQGEESITMPLEFIVTVHSEQID